MLRLTDHERVDIEIELLEKERCAVFRMRLSDGPGHAEWTFLGHDLPVGREKRYAEETGLGLLTGAEEAYRSSPTEFDRSVRRKTARWISIRCPGEDDPEVLVERFSAVRRTDRPLLRRDDVEGRALEVAIERLEEEPVETGSRLKVWGHAVRMLRETNRTSSRLSDVRRTASFESECNILEEFLFPDFLGTWKARSGSKRPERRDPEKASADPGLTVIDLLGPSARTIAGLRDGGAPEELPAQEKRPGEITR